MEVARQLSFHGVSTSGRSTSLQLNTAAKAYIRRQARVAIVPRYTTQQSHGKRHAQALAQPDLLPIYVALRKGFITCEDGAGYSLEDLKAGLNELRVVGVHGIALEVFWGVVEKHEPGVYDWSAYRALMHCIRDLGLKMQVTLCFHGTAAAPLPDWVLEEGRHNPDIFYTDKAGVRCEECLSLGIDDVPVLGGRTARQAYADLMQSFRSEFGSWLGSTVAECIIGLGPNSELKYPAHPSGRWEYPGIGEFQCYDKFMLAALKACAEQVGQPPWGLGGPHDAGSYKMWPHQTGFFHHQGNWNTAYGRFFMQWYSEMLVRHADAVLATARRAFSGCPLPLSVRLPNCHWWHNTASRGPEFTTGYYNTSSRDGYLPMFRVLAQHGVGVHLGGAEQRNTDHAAQHFCDPERLLTQQRTVATALRVPVSVHACSGGGADGRRACTEDKALQRLEAVCFESVVNQGIELEPVQSVVVGEMGEALFEPGNWQRFRSFVHRVHERSEQQLRVLTSTELEEALRASEGGTAASLASGEGGGGAASSKGPSRLFA